MEYEIYQPMKSVFSRFTRLALGSMALVAIALVSGNAIADSLIEPNPNSGYIQIWGQDFNSGRFDNYLLGTIRATGNDAFGNANSLRNFPSGVLINAGGMYFEFNAAFINRGTFQNESTGGIELTLGASLTNELGGGIVNYNNIWSDGLSTKIVNESSYMQNYGSMVIQNEAVLTNKLEGHLYNEGILGGGEIIVNNSSSLANIEQSKLYNDDGGHIMVSNKSVLGNSGIETFLINDDNSEITITGASELLNDSYGTITNSDGSVITLGQLMIYDSSTMHNEGTLLNSDNSTIVINPLSQLLNEGTFTNSGESLITIGDESRPSDTALLLNEGILTNTGESKIEIDEGGALSNYFGSLLNDAYIYNDGIFANFGDLDITSTGMVVGSGTFNQYDGETNVSGIIAQDEVRIEGGVLSGIGNVMTVNTLYVGPDATIQPGESIGTLHIDGGLTFDGGLLEIEIGQAGVDILDIGGTANFLGGDILFSFMDGFIPQSGDVFTYLIAEEFLGLDAMSFDFLDAPQGLNFSLAADGRLLAGTPVPEPATIFLLGASLMGLAVFGRKSKRS